MLYYKDGRRGHKPRNTTRKPLEAENDKKVLLLEPVFSSFKGKETYQPLDISPLILNFWPLEL